MKNSKIAFITICIFTTFFLTSCNQNQEVEDIRKENSELLQEIERLEVSLDGKEKQVEELEDTYMKQSDDFALDIKYLEEERDHLRKYLNLYIAGLGYEKKLEIAKFEWEYSFNLEIFDREAEDYIKIEYIDGMKLDVDQFRVQLVQRIPSKSILENDKDIFSDGGLDNYRNHIELINDTKYTWSEGGNDGTVVTSKTIELSSLNSGEIISFQITDALKERLGLEKNIINIEIE